jgi:hypothetical protein
VNTARRDNGTWTGYGTRTYRVRRTTIGTARVTRSAWTSSSVTSTASALDPSTSTIARRLETTHNGS